VPGDLQYDQGSQLTSQAFIEVPEGQVRISVGGGRWVDNVFIERLWRSVKYEEMYLYAWYICRGQGRIGALLYLLQWHASA
jgi:putative transposase